MHRDDSYLRDLLMEIEDSPDIVFITRRPLSASAELKKQNHHLELLCDCGFLARVNDNAYSHKHFAMRRSGPRPEAKWPRPVDM